MMALKDRLARESQTLEVMIALYCRRQHGSGTALCPQCQELLDYSLIRLKHCPYQQGKTTCAKCPTHCYKPEMRSRIRMVMRYSGPRMLFCHPLLTMLHGVDGLRSKPRSN